MNTVAAKYRNITRTEPHAAAKNCLEHSLLTNEISNQQIKKKMSLF